MNTAPGTLTTETVERAIARLFGAGDEVADAAVEALQAAEVLGSGVVLPALLLATRKGTDLAGGLGLLAGGEPAPRSWSSYEQRALREEAADELDVALAGFARVTARGAPPVRLVGVDAPVDAVAAVRAGARQAIAGSAPDAPIDVRVNQAWVRRLLDAAGIDVLEPEPAERATAGAEEPLPRLEGYVDPLEEFRA